MDIKLDFEQRHRANEMLDQLNNGSDLELFVFEFIATRDAYNSLRRDKSAAAEIERLAQVARNVYEVWAGSEGIPQPETAAEVYLLRLVERMRDEAKNGLSNIT